jgi:PAS domain S-box-containing protein
MVDVFRHRRPGGGPLSPAELPSARALSGADLVDVPLVIAVAGDAEIMILASASPIRDGEEVAGALVIWHDITESERATEELRVSEERLRLAQESADIAVWDWDLESGVITYTPEYLRTYGVGAETIRDYDSWREMVHPDDLRQVETERNRCIERGLPFASEFRVVTPSGEVRWMAGIGRGIRNACGQLRRVIGVNLDITDRKEIEAERARFAADLARSNRDLQRFAYAASHDLQEPLRTVIGFSQLLQRRHGGTLDPEADEFIAFIVEAGMRMQRLIEDLLQLSRVGTRARPLERTDAGTIIADALRLLEAAIREAGATVVVDDDLPPVMADPDQLAQVFSNLVGNAIKYGREGVPPEVRISAARRDGMVEFSVADNGIGIEAEYFDRIFVVFQRLHSRDEYDGTGIGLAIVKRIVERHGGTVRVESVPGEGSTFFFTLPAA